MYFVVGLRQKSADFTWVNNVTPKDTIDEAKHHHWSIMSSYGSDSTYRYVASIILDDNTMPIKTDVSDHRELYPEPEPEPAGE